MTADVYLCSASAPCKVALQCNAVQAMCTLNGVAMRHDFQLQHQVLNLISALSQ